MANAVQSGEREKVIITCAVTGSLHTPSMSPYLPITPSQIVEESVAPAKAGASIIHLHARDPIDGRPVAFHGHKTSCGATLISSIPTSGRL